MNEEHSAKSPASVSNQNFLWLSAISVLESFQLLVWFILGKTILSNALQGKAPLWSGPPWDPFQQVTYFRFFVLTVIGLQFLRVMRIGRRPNATFLTDSFKRFVYVESAVTALLAFSATRIFMGGVGLFDKTLLVFALTATVFTKVGRGFIAAHWDDAGRWLKSQPVARLVSIVVDGMVPLLLISVVYIPDFKGLKAGIFLIDKFYHIDSLVMSPAWAYLKGFVINVDTQSIYGVGIPVVLSRLAQWCGGFSYENVLKVMTAMVIVYGIGFYVLLRVWTRDIILSLSGMLLFISWQLFNIDSYILVWPSRTPVRYFFDVVLLLFLLLHSRQRRVLYLALASVVTGISLFYVYDNGAYQQIVLCGYVLYLLVSPNQNLADDGKKKAHAGWFLPFLLPPVIFLLLCAQVSGRHILQLDYWKNIALLLKDLCLNGAMPFYENLVRSQFGKFFMGCAILLTYLITLIYVGTLDFLKKTARENAFVIVVSVYGLCLFQYYIWRSFEVNYFVACGPFILLLVFWVGEFKKRLKPPAKGLLMTMVLVAAITVLIANKNFRKCPNLLSGGYIRLKDHAQFMEKLLDIRQDAALIQRLTREDERVCLISSFATAMLMEAGRKPFFYHAPLLRSTFLGDDKEVYGGANFFLSDTDTCGIQITMERLQKFPPQYIFIEKRVWLGMGNVPDYSQPGYFLNKLIKYLRENFVPASEQGRYLCVLKHRAGFRYEGANGP